MAAVADDEEGNLARLPTGARCSAGSCASGRRGRRAARRRRQLQQASISLSMVSEAEWVPKQ